MNKFYPTIFLIATIVFLSLFVPGCRKTDTGSDGLPSPPDLSTKINSSVSGFVTDENNAAVSGATVTIGSTTLLTDKYGYFEVNNVQVVKEAATVAVNRNGYFKAVKTYIAREGKKAFFRIKLIPKTIAGSFASGTGGTVTLSNGLRVSLPANAVVNQATNAAYSGTVNVAAYWLDPTASDLAAIMPGDLRGTNADGNVQVLTTYGMVAVQLTGAGGEALQVAAGKKATLSMPIPSSIISAAPASIPLWYFDETNGLWKEEGTATKTGNSYVGDVSHFSFWNCDVPANIVQFDCTVVTANGQPVPNAFVKIHVQNNPASTGYGYTNASGYVNGAIPANAQLVLEVYGNATCATPAYSQTFTTGTANISLGNIVISTATSLATISGKVLDCSNNPVSNGYIVMRSNNSYTRTALSGTGTYSLNILLCGSPGSSTVTLSGEDAANNQQSLLANYTINPGNNSIPDIQACGTSLIEFFDYSIDGTSYHLGLPADSVFQVLQVNGTNLIIGAKKPISNIAEADVMMNNTGITLGSTQPAVNFYTDKLPFGTLLTSSTGVTITEYGSIGEFMSGYTSGTLTYNGTSYSMTCSFRVRRRL